MKTFNFLPIYKIRNRKGFSLISVIIAMVIIGTFAMSATALTLQLNQSSIIAQDRLTAISLAWNKWNEISAKSYDKVTAEPRKQSSSNAFDIETSVGDEQTFSDSTTGKNVIISVFKKDDANPAFSLTANKVKSQASGGVPVGTILPWYGNISNIPDGFALCNGSNGTPDLRDRFLVGAGDSYGLGWSGGEAFHTLTISEMPNHNHIQGSEALYIFYGGGNQPHENRPPYYAVYYIIKLK